MTAYAFRAAVPVWADGLQNEKNVTLAFTVRVPAGGARLALSAYAAWQLWMNGELIRTGPARAGHGFFRVDEIDLAEGEATVLVAGYNVNAFDLPNQPPFFCAELIGPDGALLAASGAPDAPFACAVTHARVRRVQRYSFQRPFAEAYRLPAAATPADAVPVGPRRFITRDVPVPEYERTRLSAVVSRGTFTLAERAHYMDERHRAVAGVGPTIGGFPPSELELIISREAERIERHPAPGCLRADVIVLAAGEYAVGDLGRELSGYVDFEIETDGGRLLVSFDEILKDGGVSPTRYGTCNAIVWDLAPGTYRLTSFSPYSFRYLQFASSARATVRRAGVIRDEYPSARLLPPPLLRDPQLARIYDAAVSTFRQNTVDIFMDCPSRERAGWLCDSFFTARVEYALTGKSDVEHAFLENFLMPESFACLPEGMLPMCYPSDHPDGKFIPNWAMWYVLELEEYRFCRGGGEDLAARARPRLYALLDYFRRFENADGLLEKLESWVFIEWSHANDLTQDVNYPTNMLYARFLDAMAHLYGDGALHEKAERLREVIRAQSFTGKWFCDNAIRESGALRLSGECTESCQYYAFFTGTATKALYPALWETLLDAFGPSRRQSGAYPEIAPSNAFIGNYLRLELLFRGGCTEQAISDLRGYFLEMADRTGTLWENDTPTASCNHGFASHAAVWLRDAAAEGRL